MRIKLCVLLMLAAVLTGCNSVATSSESSIGTVMPAAPVSVTPQTTSPAVESPATSADQNVSNPTNAQATNSPDIRESDAGTEAEPTATDSGTKPEETTDPEENNTTVDSYRESIRNRVFAAADYVGVSEELKEKFAEYNLLQWKLCHGWTSFFGVILKWGACSCPKQRKVYEIREKRRPEKLVCVF